MNRLRNIALHVIEARAGRYQWVLSEIDSEATGLTQLERARTAEPTYHQAMAAGLLALQALVPDLATGPREDADRAKPRVPSKVPSARPKAAATAEQAQRPRASGYFGFGPVR